MHNEITFVDVDGKYLTVCSSDNKYWYIDNDNGSGDISFSEWMDYMLKWLNSHKALTTIPTLH
tara:strand:+ start:1772 stop:1960 length:189 start_codon:yes stop_codon:yes gene_type:complete